MTIYGLIGYPLEHSYSARFFNDKFREEGIDAEYRNFPIPQIVDMRRIVSSCPELRGLNVTSPYKQQVLPYLDALDGDAKTIGAVNTIKVERCNGHYRLVGHNTDCEGFRKDISPMVKDSGKALILGSGGAARAVALALEKENIYSTFVSRNPSGENVIGYEDISPEIMMENMIIVNATPIGMGENAERCPNIPYELVGTSHLCYDLIYNPQTTLFLKQCACRGAAIRNGLGMLHNQALLSYAIWTEV